MRSRIRYESLLRKRNNAAWLASPKVCRRSEIFAHNPHFLPKLFGPLPETYKKVTEVKGTFPPWRNTSVHWQRQRMDPSHGIPNVYCRGVRRVQAGCLPPLLPGAWVSAVPRDTEKPKSLLQPPSQSALKYTSPRPCPVFLLGFKQLGEKLDF